MLTCFGRTSTLAASLEFCNIGLYKNAFFVACKRYYETVHRHFPYSQPKLAGVSTATKTSAWRLQKRKSPLPPRQSVLAVDEVDLWKGITANMMSDGEDGSIDGVSGWIVFQPSAAISLAICVQCCRRD
ncbi:uncharacterized protein C14orf93 homolog [Tachysurus ichikawai]